MRYLLIIFLLLTLGMDVRSEPLRVAVVLDSPFVMKDKDRYDGIAIDLWEEVALLLHKEYVYYEYPVDKINQAFHDLETGKLDIFVAPLAVNPARYSKVDYTFPFFLDKVIAVSKKGYINGLYLFVYLFFVCVFALALIVTVFIFIYINILWFSERHHSKAIPRNYAEGLSFLFWQQMLKGAPDEIPKTLGGKAAILSQQFGVFVIAVLLNAGFVSYLTAMLVNYESPIMTPEDLDGILIGVVGDTKAQKVAFNRGYRAKTFESIDEGIKALQDDKIKSFLGDYTDIETYLKYHPQLDLAVSHFNVSWNLFAFAVPLGSPLRREVNTELLKLRVQRIPEHILRSYLPNDISSSEL